MKLKKFQISNSLKKISARRKHLILAGLLLFTLSSCGTSRLSRWMADSEMKRNPTAAQVDFQKAPKWNYSTGLELMAIYKLGETSGIEKYKAYAKSYIDTLVNEKGIINGYTLTNYNIDQVNSGKLVFLLYSQDPSQRLKNVLDTLRSQMKTHPRTSEGSFWHKKIYPNQVWLDGLYMAGPFLTEYAKTFNEPALYDDVTHQIIQVNALMRDSATGLFYHGWDESRKQKWSDPKTGLSPNFWSRSMGWYMMSIVDVLDFLPLNHPDREKLIDILKNFMADIQKYRDPESGMWYQVTDQGKREGNYVESSGSAMFLYTMVKAAQKGYIDAKYIKTGRKGYDQFVKKFIKQNEDGTISVTNCCEVAGLGGSGRYRDGSFSYYIGEPIRDNDAKTVGPFILLSTLLNK